ncbi:hypothetical protein AGABI2DRAFT_230152 [Agaricus bisporus var. bisporus H97]|uniref:hypothetical protein n=1 Tax=Agaricus bisporus var. bisporus (strain H97 / ATCC MYA-4626 / FGSC 10389) TaxID=936046 RepID=UPI00029F5A0B|nr:hypothetical protein AGABI2DRAFT_230152 [Agaricus bisporus var. bisporus H97]EKV41654.1 hypothetical protein AGABI2DRAFT_230152 [Agaricus bisporus var. bisporus H97]
MYTASSIFLKTLADAGITHAFVNWGSDHPGILEDLQRQRGENGGTELQIITCPNEMVALSAAQGYGQVAGKPAAVIVHVDVGTQALAGAVHNANCSRTPVLIYAGASPFSSGGEHKGGRNEFIMWLQGADIPDQSQIVRQYMRYTGEFYSAATIPHVVHRGLQFAASEPKGPIYLWARREIMEQEVEQSLFENINTSLAKSPSVEPSALTPDVARRIALALLHAENPLIITSRLGRNRHAIPPLVNLSKLLSIPIISTIAQTLNCPFSHQYNLGVTYLYRGSHTSHLASADVILVIDCDLPWIPNNEAPSSSARVFMIDGGDPLFETVGYSNFPAEAICRADAQASLIQLALVVEEADRQAQSMGKAAVVGSKSIRDRGLRLAQEYESQVKAWDALEGTYPRIITNAVESSLDVPNLLGTVRKAIQNLTPSKGQKTLILNEAITNYPIVWGHIRPETPGSYFTAGGGSLGWGLGAAVGAHLSSAVSKLEHELSVLIVGDGCFMFGVPTTAFWMARKYQTPFLTIILNNGGWRAPKASLLGVHPTGYGSAASIHDLTTGFGPHFPEYSEIAVAASSGWAWGRKIGVGEFAGLDALEKSVEEAIKVVLEEKRCAVLDCVLAEPV